MVSKQLLAVLIIGLFFSCSSDRKSQRKIEEDIDKELLADDEWAEEFEKAKKVFYDLPSPVETAMLIKRAGTEYNEALLNPIENVDAYNTTLKRSLNFGVYGANLSYASLFSQTQTTLNYMNVSKKLARDLGVIDYLNDELVLRMEQNVNNRDSCMQIITEGFLSSNIYLKEAGRPEVAALIIAGGWIEGLYIATTLAKDSPNNNELIDRIIDQKLSLGTLNSLLENYSGSEDVNYVQGKLKEIGDIYDQIQVVSSKIEPVTDDEAKFTSLEAKTEIFISEDVFNELREKVSGIRNEIVGI